MIRYEKLFSMMKAKELTTYRIRKDNIISQSALTALNQGRNVTLDTIDKLCRVMNCQPGDLLEYVPDEELMETK